MVLCAWRLIGDSSESYRVHILNDKAIIPNITESQNFISLRNIITWGLINA